MISYAYSPSSHKKPTHLSRKTTTTHGQNHNEGWYVIRYDNWDLHDGHSEMRDVV